MAIMIVDQSGMGSNSFTVIASDVIDEPTARRWFIKSAEKYFNYVNDVLKVPVTKNMIVALTSLCYNIGPGSASKGTGVRGSQIIKDINAGKSKIEASKGFARYNTAYDTRTGKREVLRGLIRRRADEVKLFLS
jgi:GH24 family phage-related lysozyme (muramidase)